MLFLVVLAAAIRDAATWPAWLAAGAIVAVLGLAALRRVHARGTLHGAWAMAGVALLLTLALFVALD